MNIFNHSHQKVIIELVDHHVDFIVVGGMSVIFHGYIRTTGDMDLWLRPTNENKERLLPVIRNLGLAETSIEQIRNKDFSGPLAFHFNNPPYKVEFLTHIAGLKFEEAYQHCEYLELDKRMIPFLGLEDLIINKLLTGRLKDQADVEELRKIYKK